jgi:hypothetical protein
MLGKILTRYINYSGKRFSLVGLAINWSVLVGVFLNNLSALARNTLFPQSNPFPEARIYILLLYQPF